MSDWDPFWPASPSLSPEAAPPHVASASSEVSSDDETPPHAAAASKTESSPPSDDETPPHAAAASQTESSPPSDETLKRLNAYIKEYLVQLGLTDLACWFMEEAEKKANVLPVTFVQKWVQLESEMIPSSPPSNDKQMGPILSLNEGVEMYLDYLEIDKRSFSEKAWRHVVRWIPLITIWIEKIYPQCYARTD